MAIQERLSLEASRRPSLPAAEHLHRYELAAGLVDGQRVLDLCCGAGYGADILRRSATSVTGVDYDTGTVDRAQATFGSDRVRFEVADAVEYLQGPLGEQFDAIVCFEGLEHLPKIDAVFAALEGFAADGMRMVLSIPNSKVFHERNKFHLTDFDHESAMQRFGRFENVTVATQFVAEGSLIRVAGDEPVTADLIESERAEVHYANNFLAVVNAEGLLTGPRARVHLTVAPSHNRYMLGLEEANATLTRANARLARGLLGPAESAAASALARLRTSVQEEFAERLEEAEAGRLHAEVLARECFEREEVARRELARLENGSGPLRARARRLLRR